MPPGPEASLTFFSPTGVKPPVVDATVNYRGSRKHVSFAETAEEFEYERDSSDDSSSVGSLTEEQLLEMQGLEGALLPEGGGGGGPEAPPPRPDPAGAGYAAALASSSATGDGADANASSGAGAVGPAHAHAPAHAASPRSPLSPGGGTQRPGPPRRADPGVAPAEYKLRVVTADKLNAGASAASAVFVEILGTDFLVSQQLPRARGTFQRGSIDKFTLFSDVGDIGTVLALKARLPRSV